MKHCMMRLLSALVACALLLSACALGAFAEEDKVETLLTSMSLRDKLAQMMYFSPRRWKDNPEAETAENVVELNETLSDYIAERRFGGILLFAENCQDAEQTLRLVARMQAANRQGGGLPMFIAADQEGGLVARLSYATRGVGAMALTATGDPENAREMARIHGEDMALSGINVDFAPVMDVNDNAANPIIGVRSFGDDAGNVSEYGVAFMEGLKDSGILTALKHFPGHGNTAVNSHTGLPLVERTHDELMAKELLPFKAAIDAGAEMVMTAHIQFPQIEKGTYTSTTTGEEICIPATMSKTILTGILREELGFDGVIVSDALDMGAITDNFADADVLSLAINAGVNMLLMPGVWDREGLDKIDEMLDTAVALTEAGTIDPARVDDSVRRILRLKASCGLLDREDFAVTDEAVAAAKAGAASAGHYQAAWDIAVKALTLLKNENGAFPVALKENEKALLLFTAASRLGTGDFTARILEGRNAIPEGATIESMVIEPDTAEDCLAAAKEADHVIIVSRAWAADCLDPATEDGFPVGVANQVIDDLHAAGKTALVISCQLPYDAACYPEADAILLCYGSGPMSVPLEGDGLGAAWCPNLPAAICAAFGQETTEGRLPVNLMKLDADFHLTDEVLYPRQVGADVVLGDEQFEAYLPMLEGMRVALLSNHSGIVGDETSGLGDLAGADASLIPFGKDAGGNDIVYGEHVLDAMLDRGVNVTAIFSPEHGFRGAAGAGERVDDSVDAATGVPILSLYAEGSRSPSDADMDRFDALVVDLQDVGLRYYTYYISMVDLMNACAEHGKPVVILDRPNPNGFYVDGPMLEEGFASGVGRLPVPVVHGMTLGELARMANGEGWLSAGKDACDLTVVPCLNYTHRTQTTLVRAPSPNLKDMRAVYLYASTCFFENTAVSVGRGTEAPFETFGSPYLQGVEGYDYSFTPQTMAGAANPPFEGETCWGVSLREVPLEEILDEGINLSYLVDAYNAVHAAHPEISFFGNADDKGRYWLDKLCGTDRVRTMIEAGETAEAIEASWQEEVAAFKEQRKPYLLYEE